MLRLFAPLLLVLLVLGTCTADSGAEPSGATPETDRQQEGTLTLADTLVARDGGEIRLGEPRRSRLLAEDTLWARALRVHYDAIVMDGHIDTPMHMRSGSYHIGERNPVGSARGHVDLPKMIEGGLDAPFFVAYVPRGMGEGQRATDHALHTISVIKQQVGELDEIEMAYTAEDVLRITRSGRKAALIGLEGGHALQGSKEVLRQLAEEGIRYVGLTHTNTNSWADSSQDVERHGGLNDLGRDLVREMNRLGVLTDLSHASDDAFYDAVEVSRAPIILSHSSARALVDTPRNITDDMLRALAANGGVIMINFYDPTVNSNLTQEVMDAVHQRVREQYGGNYQYVWQATFEERQARGLGRGSVSDIVDHIEHVIRVAGIDHVGLGSDFDGVGSLPVGMEQAARLPTITYELLKRGHSEDHVRQVLGGNTLRVIARAEEVARELQAETQRAPVPATAP